jgi:hypothetical protein
LQDQATIASAALLRPDLAGQCVAIASHQACTSANLALMLSDVLARQVVFEPVSPSAFGDRVASAIGNPGVGFVLSDMYTAVAESDASATQVDVARIEAVFGVTLGSVSSRLREIF